MFGDRNNVLIEPPAPATPVSGLPGSQGTGDGEIHLLDRLSVLYRYRRIVLSVMLVVLLGGTVQTLTTVPEYLAVTTLQIDEDRMLGQGFQITADQIYGEASMQMATQIEVLRSRDLIRTLVQPLDLANRGEFNGTDASPTGLGAALSSMRARVMRPIRSLLGGGSADESATAPSGDVGDVEDATSPSSTTDDEAINDLVNAFMDHLTVDAQGDNRLVDIEFISRDRVFAAAAANALAEAYLEKNFDKKTGQLKDSLESLNEQIAAKDKALDETRQKMTRYREDQNAEALTDPTFLQNRVITVQGELQQSQVERRRAEQDYNAVKDIKLDDDEIDTYNALMANPNVQQLRAQRQAAQTQLNKLINQDLLGPNHPQVLAQRSALEQIQRDLERARQLVVEVLRRNFENAKDLEESRQSQLNELQRLQSELTTKGIGYEALQLMLDADQEVKTTLVNQRAELSVEATATRNNVSIINTAIPPPSPFRPNVSNNLLISLFAGIAISGLLAFGLDYLDDTIKTPEDITRKLRIPFLGLVPSVRGDKQPVLSGPVPHDFGEAYRALRTSLVFTSGGESTRIITCTSAQPLEGKTTTACNLAMVLAFGGSRVLLIDADMRRPGVHKALKINNTVGLSHLLVGQARVREAIQRTSDPNFCVMTAGRTPPNPSELLSSERMKQLVANLKQGPFDWVVIDTPPVLAVTDAVILTPLVDGVTFVLGAEMTRRRLAERAVQMLMVSRPKVVGAVLNRVNFDRNKYYYSRYYGYQYKSYYGSSAGSTAKV